MNILLISPQFPPNFFNFARALQKNGANVLAISDASYDTLNLELRDALTEYYRVDDLHNYDDMVRACGFFTHKYGKLDRIESHNEYWLATDAALRTDFNVFGPKNDDITFVKRKSEMKGVFQRAGIPTAAGKLCHTPKQAGAFIDEVGYPVIAKPDIGVGAAATYKLTCEDDLAQFFLEKMDIDYFFEAFIRGELYSFDGLVDRHGKLAFYTSHYFSQGIMETVNQGLDMYYIELRDLPDGLEELGKQTVEAFNLRERFFHIEYFQTAPGEWKALEVNMRPPGGLTMDMFNYANDIDLYQEWANLVSYDVFMSDYERPWFCAYVGRKGHVKHKLDRDAALAACGNKLVHHTVINPVLAPAIGEYGYVLRAKTRDEIDALIAELTALA